MPRSFDLSVDAPVGVDEILSAFAAFDYWQARLAAFGNGKAMLDSLTVDEGGAVTVALTVSLFPDRLPKVITALSRGDLTMGRTEKWSRIGGGRVRGEMSVAVPGAPVAALGEVLLVPVPGGSRVQFATTVEVNVPLVGGQIERFIAGRVRTDIAAVQRFTNEWIAQNR